LHYWIPIIVTKENHSAKVQNFVMRQSEVLYGQSLPVIAFNILLGVILVAILWEDNSHHSLLMWLTALIIVVTCRIGLVLIHKSNILPGLRPVQWVNLYGLGAFLMGCIWGACVPVFSPFESLLSMSMAALWPCGISAGALASYALAKRVFFALSVPALTPGIIYITWFGPAELSLLGVGLGAYLLFLSIIALMTHNTQRRSFELEWENSQLANDLKLRNEAITKLNRDLEQRLHGSAETLKEEVKKRESNENRLRLLIEYSPVAIAMFERGLHYLAVSHRWCELYRLDRGKLIGAYHKDVFPDAPDEWQEILDRCLAGATERDKQARFERPDGTVEWINWEVSPWYDDRGQIGGVVVFNEVITEQKRAEDQVQQLMYFDSLTGLPNQYSLQQELERLCAREQSNSFCLVLFEIRRFSEINSALGYEGADRLLKEVGNKTRARVEASGYVARMGASIFAVVWPMISDPHQALARFLNLKSQLTEQIDIDGAVFEPQIVAGVALYPQHGDNPRMLLRNATAARHAARKRREGIAVFEPEFAIPASSLGELADLRRALVEREFSLVYQPKLDFKINRICGAEALVRWHHPVRGFVPPDKFIPLAEESGLITSLTEWVIDTAIKECVKWHEKGLLIGVNVNVSARDLQESRFINALRDVARTNTIPIESVTLEITESAVMDDPQGSFEALSAIRAAGWKLALDDYGTGYSSLAYLARLPVHELKIDQSFIINMQRDSAIESIVRSTIALGHELRLEVTAEGIEHEEIKTRLIRMGCDTGQGYGIGIPLPGDKFLESYRGHGADN
jgi:diguanylate cyclase (GGDEF)-like protein/PAS domain S-box-containing protein